MRQKRIVVNENDEIIGSRDRESLRENDIYRVSALWITNSRNEILLARRHRNKAHYPGKWGPGVSGTVEDGESYDENITKEAEEELGIKDVKFELGPKTKTDNKYHHFTQWYVLKTDKNIDEFVIKEDEVEEIKWFDRKELIEQMDMHPEEFLPLMKKYFELF
ncbi:MAG: NUDIX domain-containing protein [Candidatus Moraniibacteriota bacterium]